MSRSQTYHEFVRAFAARHQPALTYREAQRRIKAGNLYPPVVQAKAAVPLPRATGKRTASGDSKPCAPTQVRNPNSGRCVDRNGKVAKQLRVTNPNLFQEDQAAPHQEQNKDAGTVVPAALEHLKSPSPAQLSPKLRARFNDRFTLIKKLGQGAYGQVFLVHVKDNPNEKYALKVVDLLMEDDTREGIDPGALTEITILQRLRDHPNIIRLHSIETDVKQQQAMMLLEVADMSLDTLLTQWFSRLSRKFSRDIHESDIVQRLRVGYDILCGVHAVHSNGLLHLDLKPANILIRDMRAKIADFGISDRIEAVKPQSGWSKVTWPYRAPELYCHSQAYDTQVDLWALGVIFCQLFFHINPFFGVDIHSTEPTLFQHMVRLVGVPPRAWFDALPADGARMCRGQVPTEWQNEEQGTYWKLEETLFRLSSPGRREYYEKIYYGPPLFAQIVGLIQQCLRYVMPAAGQTMRTSVRRLETLMEMPMFRDAPCSCQDCGRDEGYHFAMPQAERHQSAFAQYTSEIMRRIARIPEHRRRRAFGNEESEEFHYALAFSLAAKLLKDEESMLKRYSLIRRLLIDEATFGRYELQVLELLKWNLDGPL